MARRDALQISKKDLAQPELNFNSAADGVAEAIREALVATLDNSKLSREEIALQMSALTGSNVTKSILDCCCAPSQPHRFPAEWIHALSKVTGDLSVFYAVSDALGLPRLSSNDSELLAYAKQKMILEEAAERAHLHRINVLQRGGSR